MKDLDEYVKERMKDEKFKKAYEEVQPEMDEIRKEIENNKFKDYKNQFEFVARGCTMQNREEKWKAFQSSTNDEIDIKIDNSYLALEKEPTNKFDTNAIKIISKGEIFGTLGYVGKEFTGKIKDIMKNSQKYRVDMKDHNQNITREITLVIRWNEKEQ